MTVLAFWPTSRPTETVRSLAAAVAARARAFGGDQKGATAIEYALLATGISVIIIGTVFALGETVAAAFNTVLTALTAGPST